MKLSAMALLAAFSLAACDDGRAPVADSGARQTKAPGHVSAGGRTSGEILAAAPAAATPQNAPAGTPGTPQGMEGNTGGTALGGTSQRRDTATMDTQRPSGPEPGVPVAGALLPPSAAAPGAAATPGVAGVPGEATPGPAPAPAASGTPAPGAGASGGPPPTAGAAPATGAVGARTVPAAGQGLMPLPPAVAALPPGASAAAIAEATRPAPPPAAMVTSGPAAAAIAAVASAAPDMEPGERQKVALAAAMDAVAERWRSRAGAQGWAMHPPTAVDAQAGISASAVPSSQPLRQQMPIESEKLGTAPLSADVKQPDRPPADPGVGANAPAAAN